MKKVLFFGFAVMVFICAKTSFLHGMNSENNDMSLFGPGIYSQNNDESLESMVEMEEYRVDVSQIASSSESAAGDPQKSLEVYLQAIGVEEERSKKVVDTYKVTYREEYDEYCEYYFVQRSVGQDGVNRRLSPLVKRKVLKMAAIDVEKENRTLHKKSRGRVWPVVAGGGMCLLANVFIIVPAVVLGLYSNFDASICHKNQTHIEDLSQVALLYCQDVK